MPGLKRLNHSKLIAGSVAAYLLLQLENLISELSNVALLLLDLFLKLELRLLGFIRRSAGGIGGIARGRDGVVDLAFRERDIIIHALLQARALRQQVRDLGLLRR